MRAGHYENRKESVDIMIRGSRDVINDLIGYGVDLRETQTEVLLIQRKEHILSRASASMRI